MKSKIGTVLKTAIIAIAVVLLIITAVLYYIDAPVIEEGQEPTVAQKIVLLGKQYLGELLAVLGVSAVALMGVLTKLIYNAVKRAGTQAQTTSNNMNTLTERMDAQEQMMNRVLDILSTNGKKQDIANNVLLTTFSLSELPISLREQIHNAQTEYNGLNNGPKVVEEVVDIIKNVIEDKEQTVKTEIVEDNAVAEEKANAVLL